MSGNRETVPDDTQPGGARALVAGGGEELHPDAHRQGGSVVPDPFPQRSLMPPASMAFIAAPNDPTPGTTTRSAAAMSSGAAAETWLDAQSAEGGPHAGDVGGPGRDDGHPRGRPHVSVPFVLGTPEPAPATAARSAIATALKEASAR